jgi:hypothetical protein
MTTIPQGEATKPPRAQVAKHEWIDATGKVVKSIEEATGTRYTLLANKDYVDLQTADLPKEMQVAGLCFGIRTRATNMSSASRNANGEGPEAQIAAVREFWDMLCDGEWGEGRAGGISLKLLSEAACLAKYGTYDDTEKVKEIKQYYRNKSEEERAAHAKRDAVVAAISDIRTARAVERNKQLKARLAAAAATAGTIDSDDAMDDVP